MDAPLLIADVPWLLYRAHFGLPKSIRGADGAPVAALLGTVNALLAAIEARPPRAVVACLGAEQARYRVDLYPPYHAHRDPMPAELAAQWTRAPALLESFGWTVADAQTMTGTLPSEMPPAGTLPGGAPTDGPRTSELEADDAIGSHARAEADAGGRALLLSADRDMYQCVGARVAVLDVGKQGAREIAVEDVVQRSGVAPTRIPDLIALRGDPSDGIPGAPGIGAKTAAELLARHGSLEGVLAAADSDDGDMRPRIAAALREHAELLRTFKRIATLARIDVQRPPDAPTDFSRGGAAARELGMQRLAERLERLAS